MDERTNDGSYAAGSPKASSIQPAALFEGSTYASQRCGRLTAWKLAASSGTKRLFDLSVVALQLYVTGSKAHTAGSCPGH